MIRVPPFRCRQIARATSIAEWTLGLIGLLQLTLGAFAFFGLACYFADSAANPTRSQYLIVPIFTWMLSMPLLIASVFILRHIGTSLTQKSKLLFTLCSASPSFATAGVFLTPLVT